MNTNHTVMVLHRGDTQEVVGRRGHLDLKTALAFAQGVGASMVAMRHMRVPAAKGTPELVRIVHGHKGDPAVKATYTPRAGKTG